MRKTRVKVRNWVVRNVLCVFVFGGVIASTSCQTNSIKFDEPSEAILSMMAELDDAESQYIPPFQVFDNLYYVGIKWVSAWAIDTGTSIVLIDSLYGPHVAQLERNLVEIGLNPADISHILVTHGHFDHVGGASHFQQKYGAQVVMTQADWKLAQYISQRPVTHPWSFPMPELDMTAKDGETIRIGDIPFDLYLTPGHTRGVLSVMFPVHDGEVRYNAFTWGGFGLNFRGANRTRMYIKSIDRIRGLPFDLLIPNHPIPDNFFTQIKKLKDRQATDPHPLVGRTRFLEVLESFRTRAQAKLRAETGSFFN